MNFNGLKRTLGKTGMQVTPIGIGGAWLGWQGGEKSVEVGVQTVLRGLELGVNVVDTAAMYMNGESQVRMGMALQAWFADGNKREDLVISTKTGRFPAREFDYSGERTRRSIMHSLEVMGLEYLDIALVHDAPTLEPVLEKDGALDALEDLKSEGYIRAIGLGLRNHDFHARCIRSGRFDLSLTFGDFNLLAQTARDDIFDLAEQYGVAIYNASPLRWGLLTDTSPREFVADLRSKGAHYPRFDSHEVDVAQRYWEWANAHGVSLLALNLQYSVSDRRISSVLVGPSTPEQIETDIQAMLTPIPDSVWAEFHREFAI